MNAQTCNDMSERQKIRLYHKLVRKQKKEINKHIHLAIKTGNKVVSIPCYVDCFVHTEIKANVHQTICSWLTSNGFYVRQYAFGVPMQHMDYRVSWGDEIANQQRIDEIHAENWRKAQNDENN